MRTSAPLTFNSTNSSSPSARTRPRRTPWNLRCLVGPNGTSVRSAISLPAKRSKSAGLTSGRSMPGRAHLEVVHRWHGLFVHVHGRRHIAAHVGAVGQRDVAAVFAVGARAVDGDANDRGRLLGHMAHLDQLYPVGEADRLDDGFERGDECVGAFGHAGPPMETGTEEPPEMRKGRTRESTLARILTMAAGKYHCGGGRATSLGRALPIHRASQVIDRPGRGGGRGGHGRAGASCRVLPKSGTSRCALRLLLGVLPTPLLTPAPPRPCWSLGSAVGWPRAAVGVAASSAWRRGAAVGLDWARQLNVCEEDARFLRALSGPPGALGSRMPPASGDLRVGQTPAGIQAARRGAALCEGAQRLSRPPRSPCAGPPNGSRVQPTDRSSDADRHCTTPARRGEVRPRNRRVGCPTYAGQRRPLGGATFDQRRPRLRHSKLPHRMRSRRSLRPGDAAAEEIARTLRSTSSSARPAGRPHGDTERQPNHRRSPLRAPHPAKSPSPFGRTPNHGGNVTRRRASDAHRGAPRPRRV
jgi:hypothetical protein